MSKSNVFFRNGDREREQIGTWKLEFGKICNVLCNMIRGKIIDNNFDNEFYSQIMKTILQMMKILGDGRLLEEHDFVQLLNLAIGRFYKIQDTHENKLINFFDEYIRNILMDPKCRCIKIINIIAGWSKTSVETMCSARNILRIFINVANKSYMDENDEVCIISQKYPKIQNQIRTVIASWPDHLPKLIN